VTCAYLNGIEANRKARRRNDARPREREITVVFIEKSLMKRLQLYELEDQVWLPAEVRDDVTDYLRTISSWLRVYEVILPLIDELLQVTGEHQILDLCSGGGGPWPRLSGRIRGLSPIRVLLTDKFPNLTAFSRALDQSGGQVRFLQDPLDATAVPPVLDGVRTLFSSFHHFRPAQARKILEDAIAGGRGIAVFETTNRSVLSILLMFAVPFLTFAVTPFIRPFRWKRVVWTYLIPAVPLVAMIDGIVSCLRTYTPSDLRTLVDGLPAGDGYRWEIGEKRACLGLLPVIYLVGFPCLRPSRGTASVRAKSSDHNKC